MKASFIVSCILIAGLYNPANADNSKCWGILGDDKSRPEISCTPLTEKLLLSLRGATRNQVIKAMNTTGKPIENGNGLHFITNTAKYDGAIILLFNNDKVVNIDAILKLYDDYPGTIEFLWSDSGYFCSDFPKSSKPCNTSKP